MDADLTAFSERDMDRLRRADGRPGAEALTGAPVVACHLDQPDTAATLGEYHLAIRLALALGILPGHAMTPRATWPRPYTSLDALLAARVEKVPHAHPLHRVPRFGRTRPKRG
ncbi:hypothetical protein [Streptomyces sp. NPDC051132]|uniref:hypothetical protein n=1 Tax=unclassified Streptomyces TaxID=2593676 RepID=UPI003440B945